MLMIKLNKDGFYILLSGGDLLEWNLLQLLEDNFDYNGSPEFIRINVITCTILKDFLT